MTRTSQQECRGILEFYGGLGVWVCLTDLGKEVLVLNVMM
jgi:hypothetical protein